AKEAREEAQGLAKEEKMARERAEEKERAATFQARRAENARHAIQIDQARRAWERHDVLEAERVLGTIDEPFQQTWESRHLRSLCRRKAFRLVGHSHTVVSVAFSADGQRVAAAGGDRDKPREVPGEVTVWDAATGQKQLT